jgi:membrane protease YdiL (CAAX protease family)
LSARTTTLKAWPVIFLISVTLSYATQGIAKLFGVDLPEQANIDLVRTWAGLNATFAFLVFQIVLLLPAVEEVLFRWALFRLPIRRCRCVPCAVPAAAAVSSAVFSFAHYIDYVSWAQTGDFVLRPLDNAFLALFFFGAAQCWLYRQTGRLWSPMLNHVLFNLTNLILLFLIPASAT